MQTRSAGPPPADTPVPPRVRKLMGAAAIRPIWRNELGGLTFRIGDAGDTRYAKWQPPGTPIDLAAEAARLRWASRFTPVPRVLELGAEWNYGLGWEQLLLESYGVAPDPERTERYRRLWGSAPNPSSQPDRG